MLCGLVDQGCEVTVELVNGGLAHARDQAFEQARPGQQHSGLDEPSDDEIGEGTDAIGHGPRPGCQPASQLLLDRGISEVPVPIDLANLLGVLPLGGSPCRVTLEDARV